MSHGLNAVLKNFISIGFSRILVSHGLSAVSQNFIRFQSDVSPTVFANIRHLVFDTDNFCIFCLHRKQDVDKWHIAAALILNMCFYSSCDSVYLTLFTHYYSSLLNSLMMETSNSTWCKTEALIWDSL